MQNKSSNILADEHIGRLLFKLAIPSFFGMLVLNLYNVIDTIFIGHYVGPLGIAGLSLAYPVQMLGMSASSITSMGGASLISRLIGANDIPRAERALGNSLSITFIITLVMSIIGLSNLNGWLRLMGSSETMLPYAWDYAFIILIGLCFQTLSFTFNGLTRAEGNARVSMIGQIIGAVLNIIFCVVFIVLLKMGVKGSAIATVLAQFCSCLYYVWYYLLSKKNFLKIRPANLIPNLAILRPIFAVGVSSLAMNLTFSVSSILVNNVVVKYGGDYALSAFGIFNRISFFATIPGFVIGMGMQPILGYNYGARRYKLALKSIKLAMIWSLVFGAIAFIVVYFFPQTLMGIFTSDSVVIDTGVHAAHILALSTYIAPIVYVAPQIFQATGKAGMAFLASLARTVVFFIPLILILPNFWYLDGVWAVYPLSDFLALVTVIGLLIPLLKEFKKAGNELPVLQKS